MSAILKEQMLSSIFEEIAMHPTWQGHVSGLNAEKMLRGLTTPYLYLLRSGEHAGDYYVTFVASDLSIKHQPFIITLSPEGWHYANGGGGGPYIEASINDVLHEIMHCSKEECVPFRGLA